MHLLIHPFSGAETNLLMVRQHCQLLVCTAENSLGGPEADNCRVQLVHMTNDKPTTLYVEGYSGPQSEFSAVQTKSWQCCRTMSKLVSAPLKGCINRYTLKPSSCNQGGLEAMVLDTTQLSMPDNHIYISLKTNPTNGCGVASS